MLYFKSVCNPNEKSFLFKKTLLTIDMDFYQRKEHYAEKSVLSLKTFLLYLNI